MYLVAGVVASLVIAVMRITGVLLTYEAQLSRGPVPLANESQVSNASRLALDDLLVMIGEEGLSPSRLTVFRDRRSAVLVETGADSSAYFFGAFDGRNLGESNPEIRSFFPLNAMAPLVRARRRGQGRRKSDNRTGELDVSVPVGVGTLLVVSAKIPLALISPSPPDDPVWQNT